MKKFLFSALSISLTVSSAFGDDIVLKDPKIRADYIGRGSVWSRPAHLDANNRFASDLDVARGPEAKGNDKLLLENTIVCQFTEKDIDLDSSGATPKFTCQLMEVDKATGKHKLALKKNGKTDKIKVKYEFSKGFRSDRNKEVYAEVVGTRLLWALGFGADRMFAADTVLCYGCTEDPFYDRRVDQNTLANPRVFTGVAIERKMEGDEVVFENAPELPRRRHGPPGKGFTSADPKSPKQYPVEGWSFKESMDNVIRSTPAEVRDEKIKRDALRLLAVFLDYDDNKASNNRTLCLGKTDEQGRCLGEIKLLVQDLGTLMGGDLEILKLNKEKFDLSWGERELWNNPKGCFGKLGITSRDSSMMWPHISEEGRLFLMGLLNSFANGPEGRKRVEGLYQAAHVERLGESAALWADAFYKRLEQLNYPMGIENPHFACPKRIKLEKQK